MKLTEAQEEKAAIANGVVETPWASRSLRDITMRAVMLAELCNELGADWREVEKNAIRMDTVSGYMVTALRAIGVDVYFD